LPKMLFFLIELVAYRRLELLLDVADIWLTQSADNWWAISFYTFADFLWIPLKDVADPEFRREVDDSDFTDLDV
jgi:hypothetical protein